MPEFGHALDAVSAYFVPELAYVVMLVEAHSTPLGREPPNRYGSVKLTRHDSTAASMGGVPRSTLVDGIDRAAGTAGALDARVCGEERAPHVFGQGDVRGVVRGQGSPQLPDAAVQRIAWRAFDGHGGHHTEGGSAVLRSDLSAQNQAADGVCGFEIDDCGRKEPLPKYALGGLRSEFASVC